MLYRVPRSRKAEYLKRFLKHGSFPQAFDAVLAMPGQAVGMKIGLLHKLPALRCDEVGTDLLYLRGYCGDLCPQ